LVKIVDKLFHKNSLVMYKLVKKRFSTTECFLNCDRCTKKGKLLQKSFWILHFKFFLLISSILIVLEAHAMWISLRTSPKIFYKISLRGKISTQCENSSFTFVSLICDW
jgi:hypothetical protein